MSGETRKQWPFSGPFSNLKVISTMHGYLFIKKPRTGKSCLSQANFWSSEMPLKKLVFLNLARGDHPNSWKKRSENAGANENLSCAFPKIQESLREFGELWLSHCSSRETPFREWDFSFRELFFELRELLREYPTTLRLPELREWPFRSESIFPEIGVVPRLLIEASRWASTETLLLNLSTIHCPFQGSLGDKRAVS